MTAVVAERPTAVAPLPDAGQLAERQLLGIDCARCGAYLGVHAVRLGDIEDRGYPLQLFACDPRCAPVRLPRRRPGRSWRTEWGQDPSAPLADSPFDASVATVRRVAAGLRALDATAPP